ncbi:hypothetical protein LTR08_009170 [Meristemomyces frigidus]|nr:hypothetical protein LTR08_009170 [Meristemomyces frigidus]
MEQTVSRVDLQSIEGTPEPESKSEAIARLKQLNDFDFVHHISNAAAGFDVDGKGAENDELDFQLFATNNSATEPVSKVRLRSPTPATGEHGFVVPERGSAYYFAPAPDALTKGDYEISALSGADVLSNALSPHPGSAYPWKVTHLPLSSLSLAARTQAVAPIRNESELQKKRTRPGKKSRIKVRIKLAASRTAAEIKETAEREKKIRRNREKKVKKKAREKAKKAGGGVTQEANVGAVESDESGDD